MVDQNAENLLFEAAKKMIAETASGLGLSSIELDDSGYALIEMEQGLSVEINLELDDSSALQLDFNLGLAKAGARHERLFYELLTANAQWEATRGGKFFIDDETGAVHLFYAIDVEHDDGDDMREYAQSMTQTAQYWMNVIGAAEATPA